MKSTAPALAESDTVLTSRAQLAVAIGRYERAKERVDELEQAVPRALDRRIEARSVRDAAAEAQHLAGETRARQLVDAMVTERSPSQTNLTDPGGALRKAEADYELARQTSEAIDRELDAAQLSLRWTTHQRDQALGMTIAQSPEVAKLLEQHAAVRKQLYNIEAVLMLLDRRNALPPTGRGWNSIPDWHQRDFDPELCEKWQRWLAELQNDAGATFQDASDEAPL